MADPVGTREISERLGASRKTVWKWRDLDVFPDPDYQSVNGAPAWEWSKVLKWAGDSQRLHNLDARTEYENRFGKEPAPYRPAGPMTQTVAKINAKTAAKKAARLSA